MALFDRFRKRVGSDATSMTTADYYGAFEIINREASLRVKNMTPGDLWRTQPYLRIVVNFMARNIAQLGLHTFQRVSETDRQRVREGGIADAIAAPNRATTPYELTYGLVADLALHDRAHWLLGTEVGELITRLPVRWVTPKGGDALGPEYYEIRSDDAGHVVEVPAEQVLTFHGWNPGSLTDGSSPVEALKEILAEQMAAAKYRELVWERGGKVGSVLTRPANAPAWSDEARKQFKADWKSRFTGDGPEVGGTPMLEDGMTLNKVDFNAHEMEFTEGARLALNTVASVFHIPPPMVGLLDNANYANVREFRKMLYGDTLGPVIAQIEDRINTFLVPRLDGRAGVYVEFNVAEKLQGNFEEQAAAMQTAVGAPWMERNEARARLNLPALPDGDGLVTPLNVLVGGQASPNDSGSQNRTGESAAPSRHTKSIPEVFIKALTEQQAKQIVTVITQFFGRQASAVLSALGADRDDWWDEKRWNDELTQDLFQVTHTLAGLLGEVQAEALGFGKDAYDPNQTVNFLTAVMSDRAAGINDTTKAQLDAHIADPDLDPADVFKTAKDSRARAAGETLSTWVNNFASREAAKQITESEGVGFVKTWRTGSNPRPSHARMDGETVPVGEPFSNGMDFPGQSKDPDDSAGCNCRLEIAYAEPGGGAQ